MKNLPSHETEIIDIQLTPLIDVVFVVLVCFMLVAPLIDIDNVELATNSTVQTQSQALDKHILEISVHANDTVWIGKERIEDRQLQELLNLKKKQLGLAKVRVFHDRRAKFGTYEWLKGLLSRAGFEEMEIILSPSSR